MYAVMVGVASGALLLGVETTGVQDTGSSVAGFFTGLAWVVNVVVTTYVMALFGLAVVCWIARRSSTAGRAASRTGAPFIGGT